MIYWDNPRIYSPKARGDNPWGHFFMEAERSYHFDHWLHVSKHSSALWFYVYFYDFIHVHSPWEGADNALGPKCLCQQEGLWSFVASLKKSLQTLPLYTPFNDFINVYSRRSGAENHQANIFNIIRNLLLLRSFPTSSKKISLKSDFTHICSWFYTCI